jgi:peptidoglycan/xylan/chitin deacetylase (PgdA/CDA1 family)
MFSSNQLRSRDLPDRTLCLTFDDGPLEIKGNESGPKSLRLAKYLQEENIRATFFQVGELIEKSPEILPVMVGLGHIIGNHTYSHVNIASILSEEESLVSEVARTD